RFCEHVEACEGIRQDEGLDPERLVDGASGERVDDRRRHAELAERLLHKVVRLLLWVRDLPTSKHPKEEREAHLTGRPNVTRCHKVAANRGTGRYAPLMASDKSDALTAAQKAQLEAELAELEGPRRTEAVQAIATARSFGDLSENFE